jgi:hypothetical protein
MSLDSTPAELAILTRLNTLAPEFYDSEVPDEVQIVVTDGLFKPYGVVYFGGPLRDSRDHHITSTRNDTTVLYCTVQVIAARASEARTVRNQVVQLMAGYRPPDCGEMILEGGMSYSRAADNELPQHYLREVAFSMRSNLSWNPSVI